MSEARLAIDIGGTFTDVVVERGAEQTSTKVLTTPAAPEVGVMQGVERVLAQAGLAAADIGIVIHGTTLATNALIERKGARTALIATQGHRDTLELAYEDRFAEYDVFIDKPAPLVPRDLRFTVPERVTARGEVLLPLDEKAVEDLLPVLDGHGIESVAVGFLHSYAAPQHERRVREIIESARPGLWVTLSSEVCPEVREYDRLSTAAANAYVQPLMAGYLGRLDGLMRAAGLTAPLYMMLSGGGLATLETARRFPVRLVESGPAGGAILAGRIAEECGVGDILSFDMGGTTAKVCLIDDGRPQTSPSFEVARVYHYLKGSGLPLRVPVIELVEIGAGGGSIAGIDSLRRIAVGPESAGADPGPACYGRGGSGATVTDADLTLGRLDAEGFAGGTMTLDRTAAETALMASVGEGLGLDLPHAAYGVSEIVDENMANAARIHAIERGTVLGGRTMVAFGGAAPVHASRIAEKLGIGRVVVPTGAGVGSAVGFLRAPVAYEVVRSRYMRLNDFDWRAANAVLDEMHREAHEVVDRGANGAALSETRIAGMRYIGQGHEIPVELPNEPFDSGFGAELRARFDRAYGGQYGRAVAGVDVEIMSWSLTLAAEMPAAAAMTDPAPAEAPPPVAHRRLFDAGDGAYREVPVYRRSDLVSGMRLAGPAVIAEDQTSTVVGARFDARIDARGYIILEARAGQGEQA